MSIYNGISWNKLLTSNVTLPQQTQLHFKFQFDHISRQPLYHIHPVAVILTTAATLDTRNEHNLNLMESKHSEHTVHRLE